MPITELVIIKPKEDKIVCETTYEMGDTSIYKKENIKYDKNGITLVSVYRKQLE